MVFRWWQKFRSSEVFSHFFSSKTKRKILLFYPSTSVWVWFCFALSLRKIYWSNLGFIYFQDFCSMITCFNPYQVSLAPSPWFFSRSSSIAGLSKDLGEKQTAEKELPGFLSECFTQIAVPGTKNFLFCPILIVLYEEEGFISLSLITSLELGKAFQVLFCPSPDKRRRKRRDERRQEKVRERKTNKGNKEGKKLNQEGKRRQSQKAQRMREIEKKYSPEPSAARVDWKSQRNPPGEVWEKRQTFQARKKQKEDLERKQDVEAARRGMPKGVNIRVPYGNGW